MKNLIIVVCVTLLCACDPKEGGYWWRNCKAGTTYEAAHDCNKYGCTKWTLHSSFEQCSSQENVICSNEISKCARWKEFDHYFDNEVKQ